MLKSEKIGETLYPSRIPWIIGALLISLGAGFLVKELFGTPVIAYLGLIPADVIGKFWIWQLFTYALLHGSLFHLLFNGLTLYWFGPPLAERWGEREFFKFFVICAVGAGIVNVAVQPLSPIPTIGASGAIFGIMYAWAKEYPDAVVYMYGLFPMRAKHLIILLAVIELMLISTPSPIARFAHLGGLLTGWIYLRWEDWRERFSGLRLGRRPPAPKENAPTQEEEINRILEKINERGIQSLTPSERRKLDAASHKKPEE